MSEWWRMWIKIGELWYVNLNKDVSFLKGNTASTWFSWPPCCEEAHTSHMEGPYVWAPQLTALAGVPADGLHPTARHMRDSGCSLQDFPVTPRSFLFFFPFFSPKKKSISLLRSSTTHLSWSLSWNFHGCLPDLGRTFPVLRIQRPGFKFQ